MKKKIFLGLVMPIAMRATYISIEKNKMSNDSLEKLVIENVEAVSSGADNVKGIYQRSTGKCPYPCPKSWVSCGPNGEEECFPSDCC